MTVPVREIFGTNLDEDLIGSGLAERFYALGGKDRIYAQDGDDELYGGAGNDLLDGGAGRDAMYGGSGDDIYRVDNPGDIVSETSVPGIDDGGTDYVESKISYALGAFAEKLELKGTADLDGAGNHLNNTIKGNSGVNVLFGAGGSDTLYAYDGNDVLIGGAGKDYLYGGNGADTLVLQPDDGSWDKIYDFSTEDTIAFYASDFGFTEGAGLIGGKLDPNYFVAGTAATAVGHGQFVFNAAAGSGPSIYWDADGLGGSGALTLAILGQGQTLTADQMAAFAQSPSVSLSAFTSSPQVENEGAAYFTLKLSQPLNQDVILTCSTINGTAIDGQDFTALFGEEVHIAAGSTTVYLPVELLDDDFKEGTEAFSLRIESARNAVSGAQVTISQASATASIVDEGPSVVANHSTVPLGMNDPAGIAYDSVAHQLYMSDSEIDEPPYNSSVNLHSMGLDGSLQSNIALPFTNEPTGLAMDSANRHLFISDDDTFQVSCIDPSKPGKVLWQFDTLHLGAGDPEDIAFDPNSGHLFICNGAGWGTIVETDQHGQQLFPTITLPSEISDPEALAYDPNEDAFYVGGGFSADIWKVDRSTGQILDVITELENDRNVVGNHRVSVKDIELAPASDGSGETHLYVADYGWDHTTGAEDGRMIELDPGDTFDWIGA